VDPKAETQLTFARRMQSQGKLEKAKERLQEILKSFPLSKTREEARKLLEEVETELEVLKKP
jgi:TolA-binding protein